ncbi:hypothetical protein HUJ04_006543 [Dendroctonus ponderosae]|nr:hypothetical protein HUJ04_006543 [Dendroctonus ponderosae]
MAFGQNNGRKQLPPRVGYYNNRFISLSPGLPTAPVMLAALNAHFALTKMFYTNYRGRRQTVQNHTQLKDYCRFTPAMLLEQSPMIKTVIDLTNTHRYYNPKEEFGTKGVDHVKILVQGNGKIPPSFQIRRFFDVMDQHMEKYGDSTDALVGVHCTHGLNRTGYFVCRWMVDRLKMRPDDAIAYFNEARGHDMERVPYLNELRLVLPFIPSSPAPRRRVSYVSPLEDASYDEVPTESRYSRRIGGTRFRH